MHTLRHQRGISLLELIIGLALGIVLLAGLMQILMSNRSSSRMQEALNTIQDNGRVVMEYMAREVRKADYWGCSDDISNFVNHLDPAGTGYTSELAFQNTDGLAGTEGDGLNNSDSITLSRLLDGGFAVSEPMPNVSSIVKIAADNGIADGQILFISNCRGGDIFQNTSGNTDSTGNVGHNTGSSVSPGNIKSACPVATSCSGVGTNCFCQLYGIEATLFTGVQTTRYYVAEGTNNQPTLFVDINRSDAVGTQTYELAQGIEEMQITYGEDTNGDGSANRYLPASDINLDMDRVVSVKINLLVQSQDDVTDGSHPHTFNWEERLSGSDTATIQVNTNDRRLRRAYTTTISIRNRGI